MKKFIFRLTVFFITCVLTDQLVGFVSNYMQCHSKTGMIQKTEYICDISCEDILIFGSSRGAHHYVPKILHDSLGMSCYNCAYDGCGSVTAYGLLKIILEHHSPKVILYDVAPIFDYFKHDKDNMKYLGVLKEYYDRTGIDSLFVKVEPNMKYKMLSYMFRNNSKLSDLWTSYRGKGKFLEDGYIPKDKNMTEEPEILVRNIEELEYDMLKVNCFEKIAEICRQRNIKLIYCASPCYKMPNDDEFIFAKKVSEKYGHLYINHFMDNKFIYNMDYFYDRVHMNRRGATEYSKVIAHELKELIK